MCRVMIQKTQIECMNFGELWYTLEGNVDLLVANTHTSYGEILTTICFICSGPHHGHYVAIIKSNGQWMLFDDDVVTVSKT